MFNVLDKEELIVDVGEEVMPAISSQVQKIVKDMIEVLEADLKEQRDLELEHLSMQREEIRAASELKMEELRNMLVDQAEESQSESAFT